MLTKKEIKQRYFDKVLASAQDVECACGCKTLIKNKDKFGRNKEYENGHNGRKYEDPTQYKREWNHRNREKRYQYKKSYHRKRRIKLIQYKNNECYECKLKYNGKNGPVFHFHHLDPSTKLYNIGNKITVKSWKSLINEANKCIMICANCHELKHGTDY